MTTTTTTTTSTRPSPLTWTLRLKSHKTTVLLHTDPLTTFSTIKAQLYAALQETSLRDPSTGASISLPTSPSDIQLGRPRNANDPSRGFVLGEWEEGYGGGGEDDSGEEDDGGVKGKGKAPAATTTRIRPSKKDSSVKLQVKDCPKGAGLRDNAVLAFRWVGEGMWDGEAGEEDEDEDEGNAGRRNMWGVRIASYEDSYGVEVEGDVGGGTEFEG
ncbi:hypothetical protein K505DRAFT_325891 [Melanomma pulvis-pyrius CBS 109.77]|uniref:Uncharacterized protein n=1 Tax=Melanomma pulvis-pyrius CBS 109.77 TaxID=1314802 RepID=A0A6A6XA62_9PLEO|nr:hypothetical protein K505DRAFT_325891 [Melanomma pulvis-pyrius CBS 109.77]